MGYFKSMRTAWVKISLKKCGNRKNAFTNYCKIKVYKLVILK